MSMRSTSVRRRWKPRARSFRPPVRRKTSFDSTFAKARIAIPVRIFGNFVRHRLSAEPRRIRHMAAKPQPEYIPLQVGSELRITQAGEIRVDNPTIEPGPNEIAADAVITYYLDPQTRKHVIR